MKVYEKVELALIPLVVAAVGLTGRVLPAQLSIGSLLTVACLLWLIQGGVRDVWLLHLSKSLPAAAPKRKIACMCLESSAGLAGIITGVILAMCGIGGEVRLSHTRWMLVTAGVLTLGFLAKDFVISWRPLGLRRERDHHNILFTWR